MRTSKTVATVVGIGALGLVAAAFAADKADLGKQEYDANCAICHGATGKGDGAYADMLNTRVPALTTLAKANGGVFPFARVYEIIEGKEVPKAHGQRDMMIWGDDYVTRAAGLKDDYGSPLYDPAVRARARILALTEYVYRLQVK
jgi:mono/diheme cytochrome c family protein